MKGQVRCSVRTGKVLWQTVECKCCSERIGKVLWQTVECKFQVMQMVNFSFRKMFYKKCQIPFKSIIQFLECIFGSRMGVFCWLNL